MSVVAVRPAASVRVIRLVRIPQVVGVPVTTPFAVSRVRPAGSPSAAQR